MRHQDNVEQPEMELREVLDLALQLVGVFGPDRERLYDNRPALDYFGLSLEGWQVISDPLWFFHPDDRERMAKDVYSIAVSGVAHEFEARMRRHDGEYRWFLFRDNPLPTNRDGSSAGTCLRLISKIVNRQRIGYAVLPTSCSE